MPAPDAESQPDVIARLVDAIARHDVGAVRELIRPAAEAGADLVALLGLPLLAGLAREAVARLVAELALRTYLPGDRIIVEGQPGKSVFAIVDGLADVVRAGDEEWGRAPVRLGPGEFFGEMSLIAEVPRLASVVAVRPTLVFELTGTHIDRLTMQDPGVAALLLLSYKERLLTDLVELSPVLAVLEPARRREVVEEFQITAVEPGADLACEGAPSSGFFVLLRGRCGVTSTDMYGTVLHYPELREGDVFGEISLIRETPATATVRTLEPCVVLRLPPEGFVRFLLAAPGAGDALRELGRVRLGRTREQWQRSTGTARVL